MLRQEINLYRHFETPRTTADLLTWKRYWMLNIAMLLLLIIIFIASFAENVYSRNREKKLQSQIIGYQKEFQQLKSSLPQLFFNKDVNEAVKSMQAELNAQQEIINILSKNKPFSEVLTSFSRTIVPNLWLTSISVQKNGDEITIKGHSIGNNVDEYIAKVDQDVFLKNFNVKLDNVKNTDATKSDSTINFEISMVKHEN
jgi:Tfp pilus assembly protein PilN